MDIGNAERAVNKRHPYVGTINIAIRYSNIPPNDQNNSITITIVARVDDGKYSSIKVELNIKHIIENICQCSFFSSLTLEQHLIKQIQHMFLLKVSNNNWEQKLSTIQIQYLILHL
jgi:hypothetical protein